MVFEDAHFGRQMNKGVISNYFSEGAVTKIPAQIKTVFVVGARPSPISHSNSSNKCSVHHIMCICSAVVTHWPIRNDPHSSLH
jgi:hypothetical protein